MNFIFYDPLGCNLDTKRSFHKLLSSSCSTFKVFDARYINNGAGLRTLRNGLYKLTDDPCLGFIWNGSEIGCGLVREQFEQFQIPYVYVEQGILPQNETLRLLKTPVSKETHLGITIENVDIQDKELPDWRMPTTLGKVCFISQIVHDSSLHKLKDPPSEIRNMLRIYIRGLDFKPTLYLCPHPKLPADYKNYNLEKLSAYCKDIVLSKEETIKECHDAYSVVGFNSTLLYQAHSYGFNTIALDHRHILNHPSENIRSPQGVMSCVEHAQFNPAKINLEQLLDKVKNL